MKRNILVLICLFFSTAMTVGENRMAGVQALIERRIPWLKDKVSLGLCPEQDRAEAFTLSAKDGKVTIRATRENAACMALNYYLEHYCHRSISHMGDNLSPVERLPEIRKSLTKKIGLPLRYALNYCTFNYTMSFYQWEDWEHELDWMALHGVNLMLMPVGMEEVWNSTQAYGGTPFVWCIVSNFGEQCGMYGKLQRTSLQIDKVRNSVYAPYLKGVGVMPEGINNNPVVYDMVLHAPMTDHKINVEEWLKEYITYRYRTYNEDIYAAWLVFLQTFYASVPEKYGLPESVFCARSGTKVVNTSSWGVRARYYDMDFFKEGVRLFLKARDAFKDSETYAHDMFDMLRQVQSDKGSRAYDEMITAIDAKNITRFEYTSNNYLNLLLRQDTLLAQSKNFTLAHWLGQAARFGETEADRTLALKNAKMLLTFWGPDWNPNTTVHDYAAKEWAGMLKTLYYNEWKMFVDVWRKRLEGIEMIEPDYYGYQIAWCKKSVNYVLVKLDKEQMDKLIQEIVF